MALSFIALFAGVLTVLSPCILPLLPVIVGGSIAGGTSFRRAITVTVSLGVSIFIFTFLLKVSTVFIAVPASVWNWLSGVILIVVGIFFVVPRLWDLLPGAARLHRNSNRLLSKGYTRQSFWGDVLVGAALGPVFSTCSPTYFVVLATVLPVSLAFGVIDIFAYVLGLCLTLLTISFVGQHILSRLHVAADDRGWFKRVLGVLFVAIGIAVITNSLAAIEAPLYNIFDETKVEQQVLQHQVSAISQDTPPFTPVGTTTIPSLPGAAFLTPGQKALRYQLAPELVSPDAYLNTDAQPISLAQYRGKDVVLIDFWTYSCINCQRTLPYITAWYSKYKDKGLVIIGVHTPEFAFEHVEQNVVAALKRFGITYPVVLDNEYKTWSAFQNQFWPREYLVDIDGYVVHDHAGEGDYDITEKAIQDALAERAARLAVPEVVATSTVSITSQDLSGVRSPETYFGSNRNEYFGSGTPGAAGEHSFVLPHIPSINTLYLGGTWDITPEYAVSRDAGATIEYEYDTANVYFVASGLTTGTHIQIFQDGVLLTGANAGKDVIDGVLTVRESRLYHVVANSSAGLHTLTFVVQTPGLQAYTLTFG